MSQYIDQYIVEYVAKTNKALKPVQQLADANNSLASSYKAVPARQKQFTQAVQNSSYQIADFAVQVGGGVSAMKAFSQQAPQLLSGFGAIGAAAGAAVAILAAGANSLFNFGDAADDLDNTLGNLKDTLSAIGNSRQGPMSELVTALEDADQATRALIFSQLGLEQIRIGKSLSDAQRDINKYIEGLSKYTEVIGVSIDGIAVGVGKLEGDAAKLEGIKENFKVDDETATSILNLLNAFDGTSQGAQILSTELNNLAQAGKVDPKYLKDLNDLLTIILNLGGALKSTVPQLEKVTVKVKQLSESDLDPGNWVKLGNAIKDSIDPARVYYRELDDLRTLLKLGEIDADQFAAALDKLQDKYLQPIQVPNRKKVPEEYKKIKTLTEEIRDATKDWADTFAQEIVGGLAEGKLAFKDFADYVLQQLARIALSKAFEPLFNGFGSWIDSITGAATTTGLIAVPANDLPISREMSAAQPMIVGVPRMSAPSSSGSPVTVNVYNQGSNEVEVNERKTTRGVEVDVLIKNAVKQGFAAGDFDKVMATSYGARRLAY